MFNVAVVAHSRKSFGGGLEELRKALAEFAPLIGLRGDRRRVDTGRVNGEHFAVMAGAGFDARMIAEADRDLKDRLGRAAYLYTGIRNLNGRRVKAVIDVDGDRFFKGRVSCVLAGNVGKILGGVEAFPHARPDDGLLDFCVITAKNPVDWARAFGELAIGRPDKSRCVEVTRGSHFKVRFNRKVPYELDGGARAGRKKMRIQVRPGSVTICVPPGLGPAGRARTTAHRAAGEGEPWPGSQPG